MKFAHLALHSNHLLTHLTLNNNQSINHSVIEFKINWWFCFWWKNIRVPLPFWWNISSQKGQSLLLMWFAQTSITICDSSYGNKQAGKVW